MCTLPNSILTMSNLWGCILPNPVYITQYAAPHHPCPAGEWCNVANGNLAKCCLYDCSLTKCTLSNCTLPTGVSLSGHLRFSAVIAKLAELSKTLDGVDFEDSDFEDSDI